MTIHQVIIHELQKQGGKTGAKLRSSKGLMDVSNEEVINLITELNNRYKNRNENYGIFDQQNPTRFHNEFKKYSKGKSDKLFIEFTKQVSSDLREKIDSVAPAKGGYLIFANYSDHRDFIGVFLVRDTNGTILTRNAQVQAFHIGKIEHIDFEKMAMACRINLKLYRNGTGRYLSFINKKSDTISKYFTSWISTTDTESNEQDTLYLYKILKNLSPPKDEDGNEMDKDAFLDSVYKYINSMPEKQVNIRNLSQTYFKNEETISEYAEQNEIPINTEFKGHSSALRRFIQIRAKADNIELAFQHHQYKNTVRIVNKNQIVIESASLVDKIKQQIAGNE
jgi:nucleoid-associated protein